MDEVTFGTVITNWRPGLSQPASRRWNSNCRAGSGNGSARTDPPPRNKPKAHHPSAHRANVDFSAKPRDRTDQNQGRKMTLPVPQTLRGTLLLLEQAREPLFWPLRSGSRSQGRSPGLKIGRRGTVPSKQGGPAGEMAYVNKRLGSVRLSKWSLCYVKASLGC
jgi:hypothetical protein